MSLHAHKGEIWQIDLGMVGKVRPCLILTDPPSDDELALVTYCPHTTALRNNRWEISIPKPFLKEGAFHLQQINTISTAKLLRKLGELTPEEWDRFYDRFLERFSV
jgi:mRNA interferase MazF